MFCLSLRVCFLLSNNKHFVKTVLARTQKLQLCVWRTLSFANRFLHSLSKVVRTNIEGKPEREEGRGGWEWVERIQTKADRKMGAFSLTNISPSLTPFISSLITPLLRNAGCHSDRWPAVWNSLLAPSSVKTSQISRKRLKFLQSSGSCWSAAVHAEYSVKTLCLF